MNTTNIAFYVFIVGIVLSIGTTGSVNAQVPSTVQTQNYTTFSNPVLGISFEYPSSWTLSEKENRFDLGADVAVSDGLNMFKYIYHENSMKDLIDSIGFETTAKLLVGMIKDQLVGMIKDQNIEIEEIEGLDFDKYSIDGRETATYLYLVPTGVGIEIPTQGFIVNNNGTLENFVYQDIKADFDTPESQDVMDHIINSIRFLNTDGQ